MTREKAAEAKAGAKSVEKKVESDNTSTGEAFYWKRSTPLPCKPGYKAEGKVCLASTPPAGYVDCGAGFASSTKKCAEVIGGQVFALGNFAVTKFPFGGPAASAAEEAEKAAKADPAKVKEGDEAMKDLYPFLKEIPGVLDDPKKDGKAAKNEKEVAEVLKNAAPNVETAWKKFLTPAKAKELMKYAGKGKTGAGIQSSADKGQFSDLEILRDTASVVSLVDATNTASVLASMMYPRYPAQ